MELRRKKSLFTLRGTKFCHKRLYVPPTFFAIRIEPDIGMMCGSGENVTGKVLDQKNNDDDLTAKRGSPIFETDEKDITQLDNHW